MITTAGLHRQQALDAAQEVIDQQIQNVLGRNLAWRAVSAALDEYDNQWEAWLYAEEGRTVWVLTLDCQPLVSLPTKRMARKHRKMHATLAARHARDYRIIRAVAYAN